MQPHQFQRREKLMIVENNQQGMSGFKQSLLWIWICPENKILILTWLDIHLTSEESNHFRYLSYEHKMCLKINAE